MKPCACCGQQMAPTAQITIHVDNALLALCNGAHEEARRQACEQVEVAHLLVCLVNAYSDTDFLALTAMSRRELADAAQQWLTRLPRANNAAAPRTSADLKTLLGRAQTLAISKGRAYAAPDDLLYVFLHQSAGVKSAEFSTWTSARYRQTARGTLMVEHHTLNQTRNDQSDHALQATYGTRQAASVVRQTSLTTDRTDFAALHAHVARLEQSLSRLQTQFETLTARNPRAPLEASPTKGATSGSETKAKRGTRTRHLRRRSRQVWPRAERSDATAQPHRSHWICDLGAPESDAPFDNAPELDAIDIEPETHDIETDDDDATSAERPKRFYLAITDEIVRSPSIGPKTAERLSAASILTVKDLLDCDPAFVAARVRTRHITAERVAQWQAQARLVCIIPWLRGVHAQLLVGAGYTTLSAIVSADPTAVCSAILRFATTRDGQRILRAGPPPDIERIAKWVTHAALGEPARAA